MLEAQLKAKVGEDCYDYNMVKLAEIEKENESQESSRDDTDRCDNKFVIDMSSVGFKTYKTDNWVQVKPRLLRDPIKLSLKSSKAF